MTKNNLKVVKSTKDKELENKEKNKALDAAISQITDNFGKGSVMKLGEQKAMDIESVSTGSLSLDLALGIGGLPKGRIVEIYGPESSGKTTLTLHAVAEVQKNGGFAAFIDMEHTTFSLEQVENMIRACEISGITSLIRTPGHDSHLILRLLDAGAQGIQIPHVRNQQEAIQARNATKYPPLGTRGAISTSRAADYGAVAWRDHTETSNANILLSLMIEDKEGLENLEAIASVDGVDLIAMGPSDLSESLGLTEPNHPKLWEEIGKIASTLKSLGRAKLALTHGHPTLTADIQQLMDWNVGYSNVQPDIVKLIRQHYSDKLTELRSI